MVSRIDVSQRTYLLVSIGLNIVLVIGFTLTRFRVDADSSVPSAFDADNMAAKVHSNPMHKPPASNFLKLRPLRPQLGSKSDLSTAIQTTPLQSTLPISVNKVLRNKVIDKNGDLTDFGRDVIEIDEKEALEIQSKLKALLKRLMEREIVYFKTTRERRGVIASISEMSAELASGMEALRKELGKSSNLDRDQIEVLLASIASSDQFSAFGDLREIRLESWAGDNIRLLVALGRDESWETQGAVMLNWTSHNPGKAPKNLDMVVSRYSHLLDFKAIINTVKILADEIESATISSQ